MNLVRLLRTDLDHYRWAIVLVVVLQAAQTTATLLLPALSARLIDDGVLVGDRDTIWRVGGIMLAVSLVQVFFAAGAMWFGANVAMGFGREVRGSIFRRVTEFSAREISHFGAPSLITRITNDVQQVQLLIVMTATMMIAAPLTMVIGTVLAIREDAATVDRPARGHSDRDRRARVHHRADDPCVPADAGRVSIGSTRCCVNRSPGFACVRAFTREPEESNRFATVNRELTAVSMRAARLMSATFPTVTLIVNLASVAVLWVGADMVSSGDTEIGSLIAYLSYLAQIMMAVVLATFMISMIPRAAVAAERILDVVETRPSVVPPTTPVHEMLEPGCVELATPDCVTRGRNTRCSSTCRSVCTGRNVAIIGSTVGQEHIGRWWPASWTPPRVRCWSAGSTCASSLPRCCGGRSGTCRSARSSSPARLRRTSALPGPTPPTVSSGTRSRWPRRRVSCRRSPTAREPDRPGWRQPVGRPA